MILCRRTLWTDPEQKTAKLSIGYEAYQQSYHRLCIQSLYKESMVIPS